MTKTKSLLTMNNIINFPAQTYSDVESMDTDKVVSGYLSGLNGGPEPSDRDEWHGWRNGMVDCGKMQADDSQRKIAKEYVHKQMDGTDNDVKHYLSILSREIGNENI